MISTKDLQLIRAIGKTGSLTAAAGELHVSQSAISQRLARLQDQLGIAIVERLGGRMCLTDAGERVHAASLVVAAEIEQLATDLRVLAQQRNQELRISTACYTCYRWLPFVIAAMRQKHPDLLIDANPEATEDPIAALQAGTIDVAIVNYAADAADFAGHELFTDELFAVMSDGHPLATRKILNPSDFSKQTLVLYPGSRHAIVEEVLRPAGVAPGRIVGIRMTEAIIELARSGFGIAVIAGWALDDIGSKDGLSMVRITRSGFKRQWRALTSRQCDPEYADSLRQCIKDAGSRIQHPRWRDALQLALSKAS